MQNLKVKMLSVAIAALTAATPILSSYYVNRAAFKKLFSTTTIGRISLFGDKSAAGSRAAPDLSQKTGA